MILMVADLLLAGVPWKNGLQGRSERIQLSVLPMVAAGNPMRCCAGKKRTGPALIGVASLGGVSPNFRIPVTGWFAGPLPRVSYNPCVVYSILRAESQGECWECGVLLRRMGFLARPL